MCVGAGFKPAPVNLGDPLSSEEGAEAAGGALLGCGQHDHLGADLHTAIEVHHVVVDHPDAARCRAPADAPRRIGAVNAIEGTAEIQGTRPERIAFAARREARQVRRALDHLGRRRPVRPLRLALDRLHAGPGETFTADSDSIPDGLPAGKNEIEIRITGIDDDRARRLVAAEINHPALQVGAGLIPVVGRWPITEQRLTEEVERISGSLRHEGRRGDDCGKSCGSTQTACFVHGESPDPSVGRARARRGSKWGRKNAPKGAVSGYYKIDSIVLSPAGPRIAASTTW